MPGGRPKGSISKRGLGAIRAVRDLYPDYDPLAAMAKLAHETDDEMVMLGCHKEIACYLYPKRKAVQFTSEEGTPELTIKIVPHKEQTNAAESSD